MSSAPAWLAFAILPAVEASLILEGWVSVLAALEAGRREIQSVYVQEGKEIRTLAQIEKMAEALRREGFIRVESLELLEREILAREGKTRPVQRMVSHTEFLVFGIRVTNQTEKDSIAEVSQDSIKEVSNE